MIPEDELPRAPCGKTSSERGETYHYHPDTGKITWIKGSTNYVIMNTVLTSVGVDINAVDTEKEYERLFSLHSDLIYEVTCARVLARKSNSLTVRAIKAIIRGDKAEFERLREKIERKRALFTVVK